MDKPKKIRNPRNQIKIDRSATKIHCILRFNDPKPGNEPIKAKFTEVDGTEVTVQIRGWKTGDNEANLVGLMHRMVSLGDTYGMWEDGKTRKLCQVMARTLDRQAEEDWRELMEDLDDDWEEENQKGKFIRMLQGLGSATFGPKAFKEQCKFMKDGKIKIPETNLRAGTNRLIQINKLLPYLGIGAKSFSIQDLNEIIVKSLPPKAYKKYVGDGGDELDDLTAIKDLMSTIDAKLDLKREVAALEEEEKRITSPKQKSHQGTDKPKLSNIIRS